MLSAIVLTFSSNDESSSFISIELVSVVVVLLLLYDDSKVRSCSRMFGFNIGCNMKRPAESRLFQWLILIAFLNDFFQFVVLIMFLSEDLRSVSCIFMNSNYKRDKIWKKKLFSESKFSLFITFQISAFLMLFLNNIS